MNSGVVCGSAQVACVAPGALRPSALTGVMSRSRICAQCTAPCPQPGSPTPRFANMQECGSKRERGTATCGAHCRAGSRPGACCMPSADPSRPHAPHSTAAAAAPGSKPGRPAAAQCPRAHNGGGPVPGTQSPTRAPEIVCNPRAVCRRVAGVASAALVASCCGGDRRQERSRRKGRGSGEWLVERFVVVGTVVAAARSAQATQPATNQLPGAQAECAQSHGGCPICTGRGHRAEEIGV